MSNTQQTLAQMIRTKYPDSYKDMDDATLERNIITKYPQYRDIPLSQPSIGPKPTEAPSTVPGAQAVAAVVGKLKELQNMTESYKAEHPMLAKVGELANNLQGFLVGSSHGESAIGTGQSGMLTNPVTAALTPGEGGEPALASGIRTGANAVKEGYQAVKGMVTGAKAGEAAAAALEAPKDFESVRNQAQAVIEGKVEPALAKSDTPAGKMASAFGIKDAPPTKLLTQAIKPMASNVGWDKAIATAAPDMKAAEQVMGKPIAGVDDALEAVATAKKNLWKQYEAKIGQVKALGPNAPSLTDIDGNEIADAMMKAIDKRTAAQNPGLVERIQKVADTYRRPMPVEEAEDFLQSANNDLHSYYAKNKVGMQVAAKDPETGYVVAEANQLRNSLYSKLDDLTGPGASDLKARYGAQSNVENELLRRKNVAARAQPESLQEQLTMARAYGKIAKGVFTASPGDVLEGSQSIAASKWLKERGTTDAMITRAFEALEGKK